VSRFLVVIGLLGACHDDECQSPPISIAACVRHGLDDVDLDGTWNLVGTKTTSAPDHRDPNIVLPFTNTVRFSTDGCQFQEASFMQNECGIDTDEAACNRLHGRPDMSLVVCMDSAGALRYERREIYHQPPVPTGTPIFTMVVGELTR
jgi:hypothetical protein